VVEFVVLVVAVLVVLVVDDDRTCPKLKLVLDNGGNETVFAMELELVLEVEDVEVEEL
jgi:hypothetical protein